MIAYYYSTVPWYHEQGRMNTDMDGSDKKNILETRNDMMDTRSGTIIDGRYEFGNTLGKGKGFKYFLKFFPHL